MDIRLIAFGMVGVLLLLFIGAKFYVPREKSKSKWEGQYALAAQAYYKDASLENFTRCKEVLSEIFKGNQAKIEARLERDKIKYHS